MNKNASGPAIKVQFFCDHGVINKIILDKSVQSTQWEIVSNSHCPKIQSLINNWMDEYCSGQQPTQTLPLNLSCLPPFTKKLLTALEKLPFGQSRTYQELATLAGNPKAYRATGTACGRNPFPLVIPCHRILGKGSLGGFAFGISLKQALLRFESIIP